MAPNPSRDTPVVLTPPPRPATPAGSARRVKPVVLGGLAALLLVIIGVVWILPQWVAGQAPPAPQTAAPKPASGPDPIRLAEDQRAAEAMLGRLRNRRTRLEQASVELWAGEDYQAALTRIKDGDASFDSARYRDALTAYTAADKALGEIEASGPRRLAAALQAGAAALERLEADAAARAYRMALALDPDNTEATHGLARAQHLDDVLARVAEGLAAARLGHWRAAREAFKAAVKLDPEYTPAANGLRAANKMLLKLEFERRMSAFYQALSAAQLAEAGAELNQARKLRPGAGQIKVAEQRLLGALQRAALEGLRGRAAQQVKAERWAGAVTSYTQALKIDPHVAFAKQGLARGQRRARLDQAIEGYLAHPTRLYSPDPLARARDVLATAEAVGDPVGPQLTNQRRRLKELIAQATTPTTVAIFSDGQTEVTVSRMASLGRFNERRLDLPPGDYVAVGSRRGYRDVRVSFRIEPGAKPAPITVICEERL